VEGNVTDSSPYAARPWTAHYDYWVQPHMNYPRRPLGEILGLSAADVPDRPATAFLGAHLTWAEIKERSDRLATALARFGIAKGHRVGVMLPNCPQYVIAAFAILRIGGIVVNVNPLYTPREIAVVAVDSGMRLLITLDTLAPQAQAVRDQTAIEAILVTSVAEYSAAAAPCPAVEGTKRLSDVLAGVGQSDLPPVSIDPENDVAVLQYTGGTTGVPKGAMLTHHNIFANVIQTTVLHHPDQSRGQERILLVIPFFHIYGFTVGLMAGAWQGAQLILIPKYDVEALLTAIRDFRPTYFPAVPTISGSGPVREQMTGIPTSSASRTASPVPSESAGCTWPMDPASRAASSSGSRRGVSRTRSAAPARRAAAATTGDSALSGPDAPASTTTGGHGTFSDDASVAVCLPSAASASKSVARSLRASCRPAKTR